MAVTSVKVSHDGWSGTADIENGYSFNVTYLVEVNSPQDGPGEIIEDSRIPGIGDRYSAGNDRYFLALAKSISATPVSGTRNLWEVVVSKEDAKEDDPTEWPVIVTMGTTRVSRAAQFGVYMGQLRYRVGGNQRANINITRGRAGTFDMRKLLPMPKRNVRVNFFNEIQNDRAITNSNFKPFDPAPEIDYQRYTINIEFRTLHYPAPLIRAVNCVNKSDFLLSHIIETQDEDGADRTLLTKISIKKQTCKIQSIDITPMQSNGVGYFRCNLELEIDPLYGWRLDILDRGYSVKDNTLESDGSYTVGKAKVITDQAGNPLKEPSLLDGHGELIDHENFDAVYLQYAVYPEIDFRGLNIHQPQLLKNIKD
jgi:hypothetical protein